MRTLSGDYPEIWVVYDRIHTLTGETIRIYKLISGTHDLLPAVIYFKQRPPKLPDGWIGKIHEVRIWKNAKEVTANNDFKFIWRTY